MTRGRYSPSPEPPRAAVPTWGVRGPRSFLEEKSDAVIFPKLEQVTSAWPSSRWQLLAQCCTEELLINLNLNI